MRDNDKILYKGRRDVFNICLILLNIFQYYIYCLLIMMCWCVVNIMCKSLIK